MIGVALPMVGGHEGAGAEKIGVVDLVESKRAKAIEFGATHFTTSLPEPPNWSPS